MQGKSQLIENIGDMRAAKVPVIMRADAIPPARADDRTGGSDVFLGREQNATIAIGNMILEMSNVRVPDGSRWLAIRAVPR